APEARPVRLVGHLEKAGIPFEPIHLEGRSEADPFRDGHATVFAEGLHEGFGEGGELGHGVSGAARTYRKNGGSLPRMTGMKARLSTRREMAFGIGAKRAGRTAGASADG